LLRTDLASCCCQRSQQCQKKAKRMTLVMSVATTTEFGHPCAPHGPALFSAASNSFSSAHGPALFSAASNSFSTNTVPRLRMGLTIYFYLRTDPGTCKLTPFRRASVPLLSLLSVPLLQAHFGVSKLETPTIATSLELARLIDRSSSRECKWWQRMCGNKKL